MFFFRLDKGARETVKQLIPHPYQPPCISQQHSRPHGWGALLSLLRLDKLALSMQFGPGNIPESLCYLLSRAVFLSLHHLYSSLVLWEPRTFSEYRRVRCGERSGPSQESTHTQPFEAGSGVEQVDSAEVPLSIAATNT